MASPAASTTTMSTANDVMRMISCEYRRCVSCKPEPYQSAKLNICRFEAQRQVYCCRGCVGARNIWQADTRRAPGREWVLRVKRNDICKNLLIWMLCRRLRCHRSASHFYRAGTHAARSRHTDTFDVFRVLYTFVHFENTKQKWADVWFSLLHWEAPRSTFPPEPETTHAFEVLSQSIVLKSRHHKNDSI